MLKTAWLMDTVGNRGAAVEISAIKVAVPEMATWVIDRAMQAYGGMGVCQDTPLPELYAQARMLHLADGPDEVHTCPWPAASCGATGRPDRRSRPDSAGGPVADCDRATGVRG